jgi:hypothetical protein
MQAHWALVHRARPWTANSERRLSPLERARLVREWRGAFAVLARAERVPRLDRVWIEIRQHLRNARGRPDTGAAFPAAKASVDGVVDAGVLPNDTPNHLTALLFRAPQISGYDALELIIHVAEGSS